MGMISFCLHNHTHPLDPSPTTGCLSFFFQFLPSSCSHTAFGARAHPACRNTSVCLPAVPLPPGAAPQALCFLLLSSTPPGTPSVPGTCRSPLTSSAFSFPASLSLGIPPFFRVQLRAASFMMPLWVFRFLTSGWALPCLYETLLMLSH